jgi:hypothetical protein
VSGGWRGRIGIGAAGVAAVVDEEPSVAGGRPSSSVIGAFLLR